MDLINKILKDRGNELVDPCYPTKVGIYKILRQHYQFRAKCEVIRL